MRENERKCEKNQREKGREIKERDRQRRDKEHYIKKGNMLDKLRE